MQQFLRGQGPEWRRAIRRDRSGPQFVGLEASGGAPASRFFRRARKGQGRRLHPGPLERADPLRREGRDGQHPRRKPDATAGPEPNARLVREARRGRAELGPGCFAHRRLQEKPRRARRLPARRPRGERRRPSPCRPRRACSAGLPQDRNANCERPADLGTGYGGAPRLQLSSCPSWAGRSAGRRDHYEAMSRLAGSPFGPGCLSHPGPPAKPDDRPATPRPGHRPLVDTLHMHTGCFEGWPVDRPPPSRSASPSTAQEGLWYSSCGTVRGGRGHEPKRQEVLRNACVVLPTGCMESVSGSMVSGTLPDRSAD